MSPATEGSVRFVEVVLFHAKDHASNIVHNSMIDSHRQLEKLTTHLCVVHEIVNMRLSAGVSSVQCLQSTVLLLVLQKIGHVLLEVGVVLVVSHPIGKHLSSCDGVLATYLAISNPLALLSTFCLLHGVVDAVTVTDFQSFPEYPKGNCPSAPIRQRGDAAVGRVLRNQPLGGIHGELKGHQLKKV